MKTVAVVPIKRLTEGKSRLAAALPEAVRRCLVEWMAARVLRALLDSHVIGRVAVVSPDGAALALAKREGAQPLPQRTGGLNEGLELGREWAREQGAEALLVALADLPYLTPDEVVKLVTLAEVARGEASVVLAGDYRERGTNALLVKPVSLVPFTFGRGSLARHRALARYTGVEPIFFRSPGFARDVDTPADLRRLREDGLWTMAADTSLEGISHGAAGDQEAIV